MPGSAGSLLAKNCKRGEKSNKGQKFTCWKLFANMLWSNVCAAGGFFSWCLVFALLVWLKGSRKGIRAIRPNHALRCAKGCKFPPQKSNVQETFSFEIVKIRSADRCLLCLQIVFSRHAKYRDQAAGSLCFHPWPVFVLFGGIQCSSDSSLTHCSALWLFGINALTIQRECAKRWQKVSAVGVREEEHSCDAKHGAIVAT